MKKYLLPIFAIAFSGCTEKCCAPETQQELTYENIMIYSDLSSRMNKNPNDKSVISQILDYFVQECVKPGIKVNDRSSVGFSRINHYRSQCPSARIDIESIKNLTEKQKYVNSTSKDRTLKEDIGKFKDQLDCNYLENDSGGLDILSLLYNEINSSKYIKNNTNIFNGKDTTVISYVNHIFIFTDGYLEYSKESGNLELYFGYGEIEKLRQICLDENRSVREILSKCPNMRLKPLDSENNKKINLYIMETDDRGLNEETGTLKHTGELSDNNILRTVWELWAIESGFKSFTWKTVTKSGELPSDYIKSIIKSALDAPPLSFPTDFVRYGLPSDCNEYKISVPQNSMAAQTQNNAIPAQVAVEEKTIQPITDLAIPINSTIFQNTYLRETPNNSSKIIKKVSVGQAIQVLGYNKDYWKVQVDNYTGFLKKNHIFINDDLRDIQKK